MERFVEYLRDTIINKIVAMFLVFIGIAVSAITGDSTFLVLISIFCVPLFITRKRVY